MANMYMLAKARQRKRARNMGHHTKHHKTDKQSLIHEAQNKARQAMQEKQKRHFGEDALSGQTAPTKRIKLVQKPITRPKRAGHATHEPQQKKAKTTSGLTPVAQQKKALIQLSPELLQQDTQCNELPKGRTAANKNNNA